MKRRPWVPTCWTETGMASSGLICLPKAYTGAGVWSLLGNQSKGRATTRERSEDEPGEMPFSDCRARGGSPHDGPDGDGALRLQSARGASPPARLARVLLLHFLNQTRMSHRASEWEIVKHSRSEHGRKVSE